MTTIYTKFLDRYNKIQPDPTTGCVLWTGKRSTWGGYGYVYWKGKVTRAHRVSYELFRGPIPEGLGVLHSCDTPRCVNPSHLRVGTALDNTKDRMERGRHFVHSRETHPLTKLSRDQVMVMLQEVWEGYYVHKKSNPCKEAADKWNVDRTLVHRYWKRWCDYGTIDKPKKQALIEQVQYLKGRKQHGRRQNHNLDPALDPAGVGGSGPGDETRPRA